MQMISGVFIGFGPGPDIRLPASKTISPHFAAITPNHFDCKTRDDMTAHLAGHPIYIEARSGRLALAWDASFEFDAEVIDGYPPAGEAGLDIDADLDDAWIVYVEANQPALTRRAIAAFLLSYQSEDGWHCVYGHDVAGLDMPQFQKVDLRAVMASSDEDYLALLDWGGPDTLSFDSVQEFVAFLLGLNDADLAALYHIVSSIDGLMTPEVLEDSMREAFNALRANWERSLDPDPIGDGARIRDR